MWFRNELSSLAEVSLYSISVLNAGLRCNFKWQLPASLQRHLNPSAAALCGRDVQRMSCGRSSWSMLRSAIGIGYRVVRTSCLKAWKSSRYTRRGVYVPLSFGALSCGLWRVRSKEIAVGGCISHRELNPATLPLHWRKTCLVLGSGVVSSLGAFANFRKKKYIYIYHQLRHVFCPSVLQLSVRMEQLDSHRTEFHEIWCYFSKICR